MKNITLNLPFTLSKEEWDKVEKVYKELDGWMNHKVYACWYGEGDEDRYITASVEPSGLLLSGKIDDDLWTSGLLCYVLSCL